MVATGGLQKAIMVEGMVEMETDYWASQVGMQPASVDSNVQSRQPGETT